MTFPYWPIHYLIAGSGIANVVALINRISEHERQYFFPITGIMLAVMQWVVNGFYLPRGEIW